MSGKMKMYGNFGLLIGSKKDSMIRRLISIAFIAAIIATGCTSQTAADNKPVTTPPEEVIKPIKLTKQQFLEQIADYEKNPNKWIYKGKLPGLIDFYADWCRPCRMSSPILEELAQEYAGQIVVYKIDIQAEQELASVFGIQSIPAFLFIPMYESPVMSAGIAQTPEATKQLFKQQIEEILLKK
jgi:thioredoxin 1